MKKVMAGLFIWSIACSYATAESWQCGRSIFSEPIVLAESYPDNNMGTTHVAGAEHETYYTVRGFDRTLGFGGLNEDGSYKYLFIIQPDNWGRYYEFFRLNDPSSPIITLTCSQVNSLDINEGIVPNLDFQ